MSEGTDREDADESERIVIEFEKEFPGEKLSVDDEKQVIKAKDLMKKLKADQRTFLFCLFMIEKSINFMRVEVDGLYGKQKLNKKFYKIIQ